MMDASPVARRRCGFHLVPSSVRDNIQRLSLRVNQRSDPPPQIPPWAPLSCSHDPTIQIVAEVADGTIAISAAPLLTAAFLIVFMLPAERAAVTNLAGVECMEEPNSADGRRHDNATSRLHQMSVRNY
jgi:hypothetical protein